MNGATFGTLLSRVRDVWDTGNQDTPNSRVFRRRHPRPVPHRAAAGSHGNRAAATARAPKHNTLPSPGMTRSNIICTLDESCSPQPYPSDSTAQPPLSRHCSETSSVPSSLSNRSGSINTRRSSFAAKSYRSNSVAGQQQRYSVGNASMARRMNTGAVGKKCGNAVNNKAEHRGQKGTGKTLDGIKDHRDHQSTWVHINVAGAPFILKRDLLKQHPDTLLGSADISRYYRQDLSAYYFDRNREAFDAIVNYYLTGQIPYLCDTLDEGLVTREFEYFKIPLTPRDFEMEGPEKLKAIELRDNTRLGQWKSRIDGLINVPDSSRLAALYAILDCFFILVSIAFLVLETETPSKDYFTNPRNPYYYYLFGVNSAIMAFFTADYVARIWSAVSKIDFLKQVLPWLDLLSIMPFYMELAIMAYSGPQSTSDVDGESSVGGWYVVLRVCRVFRVIRVFKLARRSENLLILLRAVGNTSTELFVLFIMVFMVVLMFGSIMYTVEKTTSADGKTNFTSIMSGCWWSVITVTTVGYGDLYPKTTLGMFVGSLALLTGLIVLALPVTVIVAKFSDEYERSKMEKERRCSLVRAAL